MERLRGIGDWLKVNGESIYGTGGGPLHPRAWGAVIQKPGRTHVHVLDAEDPLLSIFGLPKVSGARLLSSRAAVDLTQVTGGIVLRIPEARDPNDTVIVLETAR